MSKIYALFPLVLLLFQNINEDKSGLCGNHLENRVLSDDYIICIKSAFNKSATRNVLENIAKSEGLNKIKLRCQFTN